MMPMSDLSAGFGATNRRRPMTTTPLAEAGAPAPTSNVAASSLPPGSLTAPEFPQANPAPGGEWNPPSPTIAPLTGVAQRRPQVAPMSGIGGLLDTTAALVARRG